MNARGLTHDPRYHQMVAVANRMRQQQQQPSVQSNEAAPPNGKYKILNCEVRHKCYAVAPATPQLASPVGSTTLTPQQQHMFDAQVTAYRLLTRQMPLPVDVAKKAMRGRE
jgi:hypothetical protein